MTELLESHLSDVTYDPIECSTLSKTISQEIKTKVKEMDFERFKVSEIIGLYQVCILPWGSNMTQVLSFRNASCATNNTSQDTPVCCRYAFFI